MAWNLERWAAGLYDVFPEPLLTSAKRRGLSLHTPAPGALVLDVGCGTGAQLQMYQSLGCRLAGIDASPVMAEGAARKLGASAVIQVGDGAHLPYADATVDLVLMSMMLHALPPATRAAVLEEAARVLGDEGRILVLDYHCGPRNGVRSLATGLGIDFIERLAGGEHAASYREFVSAGGLPPLAARVGLRAVSTTVLKGGHLGLYLLRAR